MATPRPQPTTNEPPLGFRFKVFFYINGRDPEPIDTMFQKVSGLSASVETYTVEEGGQNLYTQRLPKKIQYENLVLERGLIVDSPVGAKFDEAMAQFKFGPFNVLVSLLDHAGQEISNWHFTNAYPVKWSISDLDATANQVVIEHMELAYQHMQTTRL